MAVRNSTSKEVRAVVEAAKEAGWEVENGKRHPKLRKGKFVIGIPMRPGDYRACLNFRSAIANADRQLSGA